MINNASWLFAHSPSRLIFCLLFLINFIFSALLAWLLIKVIDERLVKQRLAFFGLLTAFCTFLPFFGLFVAVISLSLLSRYQKLSPEVTIKTFPPLYYTDEKIIKVSAYGAGWAKIRLESQEFSKNVREHALISINKTIGREINQLNRQLLSDSTDELRLFAFSLLEKEQDMINNKISELLQAYAHVESSEKKALIEKYLAALYWELTYLNLAETEFRQLVIDKCRYFLERAVEVLTNDYSLWCMLAQVYKETGHIELSIDALKTAEQLGAPSTKVYPYLAEYSFMKHHYNEVRKYLSHDVSCRDILKLNKVVDYWCHT